MKKKAFYLVLFFVFFLFISCSGTVDLLVFEEDVSDGASEETGSVSEDSDEPVVDEESEQTSEEEGDVDLEENAETEEEESYARTCSFDFSSLVSTSIEISDNLIDDYEPSGAVWHDKYGVLFIVSDAGHLSYLNLDGTGVVDFDVSGDLEAVTIADVESDYVYIGVEDPDGIIEYDITKGEKHRSFDLTPWMTGLSNRGLEALTFVKDAASAEGGYFLAALQQTGVVYKFELPLVTDPESETVIYKGEFTPVPGQIDIAGMDYDEVTGTLYLVYDSPNKIGFMTYPDGDVSLKTLYGADQEGMAIGPDCEMFITEDTGLVKRYDLP